VIPPLIDIHNHFVPGVDDGAPTLEDALHYLREFVELGITRVVTTPHLSARRLDGKRRAGIDAAFAELVSAVEAELPDMELTGAYEICLDEPDVDMSDRELGFGDGRALLVEFPMLMMPAYPDRMLAAVQDQGWRPILAHPERYSGIGASPGWLDRMRDLGTVLCLNAGSLWGEYGAEAQTVSRHMLRAGLADIIASDHHARPHRASTIRRVWDVLSAAGQEDAASALLHHNPLAVLGGDATVPVPPVSIETGLWGKLRRMMGRR